MHVHDGTNPQSPARWKFAFWGFAIVAAFYLLIEHRVHLLGWLPYLVILACPLMHLLHHGHGHQHAHTTDRETADHGTTPSQRDKPDA